MLRKREIHDSSVLFELLSHPEVFPFVREKAQTFDEYMFVMKSIMDAEENGNLISRVITDEYGRAVGTINLFDIYDRSGYLATWLGKPFHGMGYNQMAKEMFIEELFRDYDIENVLVKIRKTNLRSIKAIEKLSYVLDGEEVFHDEYKRINAEEDIYRLFVVNKHLFYAYMKNEQEEVVLEA
ncbi:GNAT family N-acetyltransferase [Peribacillus acanthi]|uniref:GNAT family N-acetyltransferase n=1 Tax=Peribacillus acanthi TaxID=2171554 RepID=UPI000D3EB581|nr:GNAT family protein [Peribacillus acanthi]